MKLSDEMVARIEEYARSICGTDLDAAYELANHLEDEMLDYLEGGRKIDEEEAFVLARAHLGTRNEVRAAFAEDHVDEGGATRAQRTLVCVFAFLIATVIARLLPGIAVAYDIATKGSASSSFGWGLFDGLATPIASVVFFGLLLARWSPSVLQVPAAAGGLLQASRGKLTALVALGLVLHLVVPSFGLSQESVVSIANSSIGMMLPALWFLCGLLIALLWLSNVDGPRTPVRNRLRTAAIGWAMLSVLSLTSPILGLRTSMDGAIASNLRSLWGLLPSAKLDQVALFTSVFFLPYLAAFAIAVFVLRMRDRRAQTGFEIT